MHLSSTNVTMLILPHEQAFILEINFLCESFRLSRRAQQDLVGTKRLPVDKRTSVVVDRGGDEDGGESCSSCPIISTIPLLPSSPISAAILPCLVLQTCQGPASHGACQWAGPAAGHGGARARAARLPTVTVPPSPIVGPSPSRRVIILSFTES